ncbi:hypothetical protein D9611_003748 [Ephemerocybe angulata]|uniref:Nephrocystin 3-like N-terminal domain-containing protein n=1 Tax=Ephemerocybe angulata TaxID=980116 RepID=A0A8H5B573_9AGAR|nr:hypothetical protein D9611_003748 [Tulosesus angulatus]
MSLSLTGNMASKRQRSPPHELSNADCLPPSKKGKIDEVSSAPSTSTPSDARHAPTPSSSTLDRLLLSPTGNMASKRQGPPPHELSNRESLPLSKNGKAREVSPSTSTLNGPPPAPTPSSSALHSAPTFFPNAHAFQLDRLEYTHTAHHHYPPRQAAPDGWKLLIEKSAPNALYNSAARFDAPKCDEDTRIEVTNEIMGWIQDRDAPTQILCMTGAAGAGKSALQQTVSERCARGKILAASFFFNAADPTRDNVSGLVPTIAYQLGLGNHNLRQFIGDAVEHDPLVFDKELKTQMEMLIVDPVHRVLANHQPNSEAFPYVLLIDGLDECSGEDRQRELLVAIQECLLRGRTPFRIFLASRPEMAIYEALHESGHLHNAAYHIRLSDDYDATGDIRRSVQRRLHELGLRRKLKKGWLSESDVEAIVEASSGQYVYAATVTRYISEPRGSPAERLRAVLTWAPGKGHKAKPFASLDFLYRHILLRSQQAFEEADDGGRDFLLLLNCFIDENLVSALSFQEIICLLDLGTPEAIICDLRSIFHISPSDILTPYHRSLHEFMYDPDRAGPVYVGQDRIQDHITKCCLAHISESSLDDTNDGYSTADREDTVQYNSDLLGAWAFIVLMVPLDHLPKNFFGKSIVPFIENDGFEKVDKWFRSPVYEAPAKYTFTSMIARRRAFFYGWEKWYCSYLLQNLEDLAPELTIALRKYGGIPMASKRQRSPPSVLSSADSLPPPKKGKTSEVSSVPSTSTLSDGRPAPTSSSSALHSAPTFFPNAHAFQLDRLEYTHTAHHHYPPKQAVHDGWKLLVEKSAPNALHDSSARFDPPKCDEDTRIEVTKEIMSWIQDRDTPTQILCMTGAAGSGKSALQQTVSERCASLRILAAAFFFNVADPSRNNISGIVPTIAYQLGQKETGLKKLIGLAVENDPLIFGKALKAQMEALIVGPVHRFLANNPSNSRWLPHALLIDGLDECSGENRQRELLIAIQDCLLRGRTPFRVFLASRPEMAIREALHESGHLHNAAYHMRLSDDYDATGDIRRSVQRRLHELGLRRKLKHGWFSHNDIDVIVEAASGKYIYAVTVTRYISEPRGSPTERLRAVLTWTPGKGQNAKPFASLDMLYRNIIIRAQQAFEDADEGDRDFLLLLNCVIWVSETWTRVSLKHQEKLYLLDSGASEIILCDLRSIIDIDIYNGGLKFYHKSFLDFLQDEARAGTVYVCRRRMAEYFSKCCLDRISELSLADINDGINRQGILDPEDWDIRTSLELLQSFAELLVNPDPSDFLEDSFAEAFVPFIENGGLEKIDKWLRAPDDEEQMAQTVYWQNNPYITTRTSFFRSWRERYCSWLLLQLQELAPELDIVVRKYDGLWNIWWQERFKNWHDNDCDTCSFPSEDSVYYASEGETDNPLAREE